MMELKRSIDLLFDRLTVYAV